MKKELRKLQAIEPSTEWKNRQWEVLKSQIAVEEVVSMSFGQKVVRLLQHPSVFKPLGNMAVVVLLVLVGSWTTVASAQRSGPGSFLYTVKVGLEKVDLALTVDSKSKATKQTNIARVRVQELTTIVQDTVRLPEHTSHVDRTVKNLQHNLQEAQFNLQTLTKRGGNGDAVAAAAKIEREVAEISKSLEEATQALPAEVRLSMSQEIAEVTEAITDTSDQALEVLLTQGNLAEEYITEEEILERLQVRVDEAAVAVVALEVESWLAAYEVPEEALEESQSSPEQVAAFYEVINEQLDEIEVRIEAKDYVGVLHTVDQVRADTKVLYDLMHVGEVKGEEEVVEEAVEEMVEVESLPEAIEMNIETTESTEAVAVETQESVEAIEKSNEDL